MSNATSNWNPSTFSKHHPRLVGFVGYLSTPCLGLGMILALHWSAMGRAEFDLKAIGMSVLTTADAQELRKSLSGEDKDSTGSEILKPLTDPLGSNSPASSTSDPVILSIEPAIRDAWVSLSMSDQGNYGRVFDVKERRQAKWIDEWVEYTKCRVFLARHAVVISFMTLVPFGFLATALFCSDGAYRRQNDLQRRRSPNAYRRWFRTGAGIRFLLGCVIAYSWSLHVCPDGRSLSFAKDFVTFCTLGYGPTVAQYFRLQNGELAPILAGMLGWYVHLFATTLYRSRQGDVVSTGIQSLMVQRFFLVIGIAMVTRYAYSGGEGAGAIPLFLLFVAGVFPTTALRFIGAFIDKSISSVEEPASLTQLPIIPFSKVSRLSEEGISDVVDLANMDIDRIADLTAIRKSDLAHWADRARLASVVGANGYAQLRTRCRTASEFLRRVSDPTFVAELEKIQIRNPEELARLIRKAWPLIDIGPVVSKASELIGRSSDDTKIPLSFTRDFELRLPLFNDNCAWRQLVVESPEKPNQPRRLEQIHSILEQFDQNFMYIHHDRFTIPIFPVDPNGRTNEVTLKTYFGESWRSSTLAEEQDCDGDLCRLQGIPIPAGPVRPALPCGKDSDGHLVLVDPKNRFEVDFFAASTVVDKDGESLGSGLLGNSIPYAGVVERFSLDGDGAQTPRDDCRARNSARASGVPLLAGLLLPEDFTQTDEIEHALVFAFPGLRRIFPTQSATPADYVYPASKTEPSDAVRSQWALGAGERIRLSETIGDKNGQMIDESNLRPVTRRFLRALRTYGAYLVDGSGAFTFYAEDVSTANLKLGRGDFRRLAGEDVDVDSPDRSQWSLLMDALLSDIETIPFTYEVDGVVHSNFAVVADAEIPPGFEPKCSIEQINQYSAGEI
ncbi:hypothetical protein U8335_00525 [Roseiconus lacunae]|uniref:hypothetical protein n=1 Tax=Roseiconus lacunae TaxID=2605694 RepID=UPI00308B2B67|nr:hypothetical protein U8335_00525 [Stieleria sp. HD01]